MGSSRSSVIAYERDVGLSNSPDKATVILTGLIIYILACSSIFCTLHRLSSVCFSGLDVYDECTTFYICGIADIDRSIAVRNFTISSGGGRSADANHKWKVSVTVYFEVHLLGRE